MNAAVRPARPHHADRFTQKLPQGLLKAPLAELIRLKVDGNVVQTTLVSPERQNGLRGDHYHRWTIANLSPGKHAATADVRVLATKAEMSPATTIAASNPTWH